MEQCKFDRAWIGRCTEPADESGFCEQHDLLPCVVCQSQATHDCDHTGQFVCGAPLCDQCHGYVKAHEPSGVFGFMNHYHKRIQDGE